MLGQGGFQTALHAFEAALVGGCLFDADVVRAVEFQAHVFDDDEVFFQEGQVEEAGNPKLQAVQGCAVRDADGGKGLRAALFGRVSGGVFGQEGENARRAETADAALHHDAAADAGVD